MNHFKEALEKIKKVVIIEKYDGYKEMKAKLIITSTICDTVLISQKEKT